MTIPTKEEREARRAELKRIIEKLAVDFDAAKRSLAEYDRTFYVGEKVKVLKTCPRGCCEEEKFVGTIKSREKNGTYEVVTSKEEVHRYTSPFDMTRIEP